MPTSCGYRCVDGEDVGFLEYANMINVADPNCPEHGENKFFKKNNKGELYTRELVNLKDEGWHWMTNYYANDPHEDISHCHLRTEWEKL